MKRPANNTSEVSGVSWRPEKNKWRARINREGKGISLGCFSDFGDDVEARHNALKAYGYHPNHGRG